jgi:hypothetical protein
MAASSAFAGGFTTYTVNGQTYTRYDYSGTGYSTLTGPNGYNAQGYTFPGGQYQNWTVNPGYNHNRYNRNGW